MAYDTWKNCWSFTNVKLWQRVWGGMCDWIICTIFLQYAPSAWVRDKVRESLPMERPVNGAKWHAPHTVPPICWSLALRSTCGHPEAGGRGGLSPLSSAHPQISNFSSGRQTFHFGLSFERKQVIYFQAKSDLSSLLSKSLSLTPQVQPGSSVLPLPPPPFPSKKKKNREPTQRVQLQQA